MRRALEETLLPTPLRAASIKYDGTCFGKLATGELVGRNQTLGASVRRAPSRMTPRAAGVTAALE